MVIASLLSVQAGKCPYGYGSSDTNTTTVTEVRRLQTVNHPGDILTCNRTAVTSTNTTTFNSTTNYQNIANGVITQYDLNTTDKNTYAACLVRLAGHDFMDYRNNSGTITGGSDGCVNFNDNDNKGLASCLTATGIQSVYNDHCDYLSLADFIVLSSEAVTVRTASKYDSFNRFGRGTLGSRFANRFKVGRNTSTTCNSTGLMPDANDGCTGLKNIFLEHIYNKSKSAKGAWRLVAAISGAHTLGQAKVENSGFNGHWSDASNSGKFNNDYYRSMLLKGWGPELGVSTGNDQWQRID